MIYIFQMELENLRLLVLENNDNNMTFIKENNEKLFW